MKRPNVVLLTIDSLRLDRLGCYGHPKPITPSLDRLAATGIRFDQAITGGSWTQAAFPALFTSTYASMFGGCLGPLAPERPSPIEQLALCGYETAGFSTHPLLSKSYGYNRGFTAFFDMEPNNNGPLIHRIKGAQVLLQNPWFHYGFHLIGKRLQPPDPYPSAAKVNEKVYDYLRNIQEPFFTWIHYMDVHWPYHLEQNLLHPHDLAQAWRDLADFYDLNWHGKGISRARKDYFIRLYESAVRYTDNQVGQLVDYLERMNLSNNTIVVIVSDHGEEFLERRHWGHVEINLYDEILRVPLIIHLPADENPKTVSRQVRTLDLMPTILELCDCPLPAGVLGASLVPLWTGRESEYGEQVAICERWREDSHIVALRTENFKYIWNSDRPDQPELYDLMADSGEKHDVIDDYPNRANQFSNVLSEHLQKVAQTTLINGAEQVEVDDRIRDRLRDLGYVE